MTLQEIIDLGYTSVVAKVDGYQEAGLLGIYQPFRTTRSITFKINPDLMLLLNDSFWICNEESLDYTVEDGEAILYWPDIYEKYD